MRVTRWQFDIRLIYATILASELLGSTSVSGEESKDVTFSTRYASGRPTTADFYYNGRAIGTGREGLAAIVERIGKLPAGTSIVWGPNYGRCGSCSGAEPDCVPKFLYPDLWTRLETSLTERRLILSSTYPGPWSRSIKSEERTVMPVAVPATDNAAKQRFDAVIDWVVGENASILDEDPNHTFVVAGRWHRFSSGGKTLSQYDLELFLDQLPNQSRVLIRIALHEKIESPKRSPTSEPAECIRTVWQERIGAILSRGGLRATLTSPPNLVVALQSMAQRSRLRIDWSNFHGSRTPHEEVLYSANDHYMGRGDEGFSRILAEVEKLPQGADIVLTRYQYGGRAAAENFSRKELNAKNAQLRIVVPYPARKHELDTAIARRRLNVTFSQESPHEEAGTVVDWRSGDRFGRAFVTFGRIVHHDEQRSPAAARVGWNRYKGGDRLGNRQIESAAVYTVNDVEEGQGVAGFVRIMDKLASLPMGSVVQVRVCLRTKGPFVCPLIYEGVRHFERTGFEPYYGMFPWLIDVARKQELEVQWIPDEQESCGDCELSR